MSFWAVLHFLYKQKIKIKLISCHPKTNYKHSEYQITFLIKSINYKGQKRFLHFFIIFSKTCFAQAYKFHKNNMQATVSS